MGDPQCAQAHVTPVKPARGVVVAQQAATVTPPKSSTIVLTATATIVAAPSTIIHATPIPYLTNNLLPSNPDETRKAIFTAILTIFATLSVVFFKKIFAFFHWLMDAIWQRLKIERAVEARYRRKVAHELRTVQILTMPEEKRLDTFFIPLRLLGWIEPDLRDGNPSDGEPIHLHEALQEFERITILGSPGAGKTTITSHAAASIADGAVTIGDKRYLPIYIHLRRLRDFLESKDFQTKSLEDLACESLGRHGFPHPDDYLTRKIGDGSCIIVLDGFDELADKEGILQQRLANKVKDLVDTMEAGNRIVLTSRSAGYVPAWFGGFRVLEMSELSLDQSKQFAVGWFGAEKGDQISEFNSALDNSTRLQLLVANPLMLAIVCFVMSTKNPNDKFLPNRRVDVYDRCLQALIVQWDRTRGVNRDAKFTPEEIETVLRHVAYDGLRSQRVDFQRNELLALIRSHLPKAKRRIFEDEDFMTEVLQHTGLFREKGQDTIGFLHLTFQEYLAAQVIVDKINLGIEKKDIKAEIGEVLNNAVNPAWTEPIALAAGIMRGRTDLVTILYEELERQPGPELEMLLAMCIRDAELEDLTLSEDYLQLQDDIIGSFVETAVGV